jgi:hypothetical protein
MIAIFLLITVRFSYLKNLESKNFPLVMGIEKIRIRRTVGFATISKPLKEQLGFMSKWQQTRLAVFQMLILNFSKNCKSWLCIRIGI